MTALTVSPLAFIINHRKSGALPWLRLYPRIHFLIGFKHGDENLKSWHLNKVYLPANINIVNMLELQ